MIRQTVSRIKDTLRHRKPRHRDRVNAHRRKTRKRLIYEGPVYVRPIGRGIVLDDERSEPHLDEWIETWLIEVASHRFVSGGEFRARLRIVVEYVGERAHTFSEQSAAERRPRYRANGKRSRMFLARAGACGEEVCGGRAEEAERDELVQRAGGGEANRQVEQITVPVA